jgi:BirA family biotin operon repressor/biotin-[acetyl-CoA-carboxylase] ligase
MINPLDPIAITKSLGTAFIGRNVICYPSLKSTMDTARIKAREGVPEGTVVITDEQTAGRGRLKRGWISPAGNIALSVILRPEIGNLPYIMMIASLAAAGGIEHVTGLKVDFKWPNDVMIGGKKVGGILIENEFRGDRLVFSIVGIGVNAAVNIEEHPEISGRAASLPGVAGKDRRADLIRGILREVECLYIKLPEGRDIYESWRDKLITLGQPVKATSITGVVQGIAEAVDESGALMIREVDGKLTRVVAGDVTLRED